MFVVHSGVEIKKDQINPAERKPLYSPWLAASAFVGLNNSAGIVLNVFLPTVSQANISIHKIYRCSNATKAVNTCAMMATIFSANYPE